MSGSEVLSCRLGHEYVHNEDAPGCPVCKPPSWRAAQKARKPVHLRSEKALAAYRAGQERRRLFPDGMPILYKKLRRAGLSRHEAVAEVSRGP